ncbi:MAG: polyprenyl synthetase family protein [Clostridia bacterium]
MKFNEQLANYTSMTDDMLRQILDKEELSVVLHDSMAYSLFAGGKRLRPALCLATCELLHGSVQNALMVACAVEMIHCYSLIHDDLPSLDNDDMRRGKPSNHVAFGEANAILAGDGLQALAFKTLAAANNPRAFSAIADGGFDMVVGQSYDLTVGNQIELLPLIHRLKTAALIRASMISGAYCANPTGQEIYSLTQFSELFGLLFQITDDILDADGDATVLGKSVGKDFEEGKLTFVRQYGLAGARQKAALTAVDALKAIECFGERNRFFANLVAFTLDRRV